MLQEEAAANNYDKVTMENNKRFPLKVFENRFQGQARVVAFVASATQIGIPIVRQRLFATALSHRSLIWLGPDDNEEIYLDFLDLFGKRVVAVKDPMN